MDRKRIPGGRGMDLQRFGQTLRELRERRGLTQDDVVERSRAYRDARSVRKIESGEQRPKREIIISLLTKGLDEQNCSTIDNLLRFAGYDPLRDSEITRLDLRPLSQEPQVPPPQPSVDEAEPTPEVERRSLIWKVAALLCVLATIGMSVILGDVFLIVSAIMYAALYPISILLESAHDFKGDETVAAALLSFAIIWLSSAAALWAETSILRAAGLWIGIAIFVTSAILQWVLVRPALPALATVPTSFQSMTGRAAHLKNTGYYLIFVFSFWVLPVRCVAIQTAIRHKLITNGHGILCPPPLWLWMLLGLYLVLFLPMGHTLLGSMRAGPHFDRYLTLILSRAIVGLLLSVICLIWYSIRLSLVIPWGRVRECHSFLPQPEGGLNGKRKQWLQASILAN